MLNTQYGCCSYIRHQVKTESEWNFWFARFLALALVCMALKKPFWPGADVWFAPVFWILSAVKSLQTAKLYYLRPDYWTYHTYHLQCTNTVWNFHQLFPRIYKHVILYWREITINRWHDLKCEACWAIMVSVSKALRNWDQLALWQYRL